MSLSKPTIPIPSAVVDPAHIPTTWLALPKTPRSAKRQGLGWYFCARPCSKGHYSIRLAAKPGCPQCARDQKREYYQRNKLGVRAPASNIGE